MIEIKGIEQLINKLDRQKLAMHRKVQSTVRNIAKNIFIDLVKNTPQWSGNLASHWSIVYGDRSPQAYSTIPGYLPPGLWGYTGKNAPHYKMGEEPAVTATLNRELPKLNDDIGSVKWNTKIKFVNTADYAAEIEAGLGPESKNGGRNPIRNPENKIPGYALGMMKGYIETKYRYLKNVKAAAK